LISLLRHNGLFVVVLMFGGLLVAFRAYRRPLALAATAIVAAVFLVRGPLETALGVPPTSRYYLLANQTHQVAAMLRDGAELTPSQDAVLTAVMPLEKWKSTYNCYSVIPTMAAGNGTVVEQQAGRFVEAFRTLAIQHPLILLKRQICVSTLVWSVRPTPGHPLSTFYPGIVDYPASPKSDPQLPRVREVLLAMANWTLAAAWRETIFWRPATYLYVTVLCVGALVWRTGRRAYWVLLLPSAAQSVVLLGLNVVQDFRYQFGVYLIGLVALTLPLARVDVDDAGARGKG
jgi:hypothetical protein